MLQINPAEIITVNRILKDPNDTETNYVRAVVYNADTRAVLETLNLTDNGSRWFSKTYTAPYDNPYMRGRRIIIITTVYTNSGYTTVNPNYNQESEEYLIQERWNPATNAGLGGGGVDIDYKEVRKIIKEELKNIEFPEPKEIVFPKPIDTKALVDEISLNVEACVAGIPVPEKVDLTPLEIKLTSIVKEINNLPKFKETDLTPVLEGMQNINAQIKKEIATGINRVGDDYQNALQMIDKKDRTINVEINGDTLAAGQKNLQKSAYLENLKMQYQ